MNHDKQNHTLLIVIIFILMFLFAGIAIISFYLAYTSNLVLYKMVLNIILIAASLMSFYIFMNSIFIIKLLKGQTISAFGRKVVKSSLGFIYPKIVHLGVLFGLNKDKIQKIFSEINNRMILSQRIKVRPEEILVLLPHCLQRSACKHKITNDISNCKRCAACDIDDSIGLKEKYGVKMFVATGGTVARKIIKDQKTRAIIAVACERDLISGILDVRGIPVIGIVNDRPEGPCMNTRVKVRQIEEVIQHFISGGE